MSEFRERFSGYDLSDPGITDAELLEHFVPQTEYMKIGREDILHTIEVQAIGAFAVGESQKSRPQELLVAGSEHRTDPAHWYYSEYMRRVMAWIRRTHGQKRTMVLEGLTEVFARGEDGNDSIEHHFSEGGLCRYLADTYDIPVISGEPTNLGEIAKLAPLYPAWEIALYYFVREIPVWHRMQGDPALGEKPSFQDYMESVLHIYRKKLSKLMITDNLPPNVIDQFNLDTMHGLYKDHFQVSPDPLDTDMNALHLRYTGAHTDEDMLFREREVARVAGDVMDFRDLNFTRTVLDRWYRRGHSLGVIAGKYHTLRLENIFMALGKDPNPRLPHADQFPRGYIIYPKRPARKTRPAELFVDDLSPTMYAYESNRYWPYIWPALGTSANVFTLEQLEDLPQLLDELEPWKDSPYLSWLCDLPLVWDTYLYPSIQRLEAYAEQLEAAEGIDSTFPPEATPESIVRGALLRIIRAFNSESDDLEVRDVSYDISTSIYHLTLAQGQDYRRAATIEDAVSKHLYALGDIYNNSPFRYVPLTPAQQLKHALLFLNAASDRKFFAMNRLDHLGVPRVERPGSYFTEPAQYSHGPS